MAHKYQKPVLVWAFFKEIIWQSSFRFLKKSVSYAMADPLFLTAQTQPALYAEVTMLASSTNNG